jgi:hypothetical protein
MRRKHQIPAAIPIEKDESPACQCANPYEGTILKTSDEPTDRHLEVTL